MLSAQPSRHHSDPTHLFSKVTTFLATYGFFLKMSLFWKFSFDTRYLRHWCNLLFVISCTIYWNITCNSPQWVRASSIMRFLCHTQRRNTFGRIPLDEWSARRTDLYLTTHNTTAIHATGGIRTHNLSRRAAADQRLRPLGHWDRH